MTLDLRVPSSLVALNCSAMAINIDKLLVNDKIDSSYHSKPFMTAFWAITVFFTFPKANQPLSFPLPAPLSHRKSRQIHCSARSSSCRQDSRGGKNHETKGFLTKSMNHGVIDVVYSCDIYIIYILQNCL